ncbi:putative trichothecene 3-O-acetyltransferase [Astrocystis sublimbata]|nr:putative trichothecene 3-O-acetyltransferase [Astrocystis sublimbata]
MATTSTATSPPELDITLDLYGQRLVRGYTPISFCFAVPSDYRVEDIAGLLDQGASRLGKSFPWVTGQIVCEGAAEGVTGTFKIKSLEAKPRVIVEDLRNDSSFPSWDALQESGFPMATLKESIVAPRVTRIVPSDSVPEEVFTLKATIINGGLILTFSGHHQAMDGIGQAQIMSLFSKACRNESFTEEELKFGNLAPENAIPVLDDSWTPGPELEYNIVKMDASLPGPGRTPAPLPADPGVWSYTNFSAAALNELKAKATETLPPGTEYITTDDALTAFIWQSVTRARLPQFDGATRTVFARAVDLRRYLGITPTHPGFIQEMTHHDLTMEEVAHSPLGALAANFRAAVDPKTSNLGYHGRSLATHIRRNPDGRRFISFLAGGDMAKDILLSSWANQDSYALDFGLKLGRPRMVKRPFFECPPGLIYPMPKTPEGNIGVAVRLGRDDTRALKADGEFLRFATCVE